MTVELQTIKSSNADFVLTPEREATYIAIDAAGGVIQLGSGNKAVTELAGGVSMISKVIDVANPILSLIAGAAVVYTAINWTIPDAWDALQEAYKVTSDAEVLTSAKLGLVNHVFYGTAGAARMGVGSVGLASLSPALTGGAATLAQTVTSMFFGGVYAARGLAVLYRAQMNLRAVHQFYSEFRDIQSIDGRIEFMQEAEAKGEAYLNRRMDASCMQAPEGTYTAKGLKVGDKIIAYTEGQKKEYIKRVDKAIYTERLKHIISLIISLTMILGGIATILAATVFTGGLALFILTLVSAVFFSGMEYIFMVYDSSKLFQKLRDKLYTEPVFLDHLEVIV